MSQQRRSGMCDETQSIIGRFARYAQRRHRQLEYEDAPRKVPLLAQGARAEVRD